MKVKIHLKASKNKAYWQWLKSYCIIQVEQEEKLQTNLAKIGDIIAGHKVNKQSLENIIYSELNSMFYKHL